MILIRPIINEHSFHVTRRPRKGEQISERIDLFLPTWAEFYVVLLAVAANNFLAARVSASYLSIQEKKSLSRECAVLCEIKWILFSNYHLCVKWNSFSQNRGFGKLFLRRFYIVCTLYTAHLFRNFAWFVGTFLSYWLLTHNFISMDHDVFLFERDT